MQIKNLSYIFKVTCTVISKFYNQHSILSLIFKVFFTCFAFLFPFSKKKKNEACITLDFLKVSIVSAKGEKIKTEGPYTIQSFC